MLLSVVRNPAALKATEPHNGWTLLHLFAGATRPLVVQTLLAHGADTEPRDRMFRTALHLAARGGFPVPKLLPAPDALPEAAEGLLAAARESPLESVKLLLKEGGARVTARDSHGFTALHYAAQAGNTDVVCFLLDLHRDIRPRLQRAPVEAVSNHEDRALHLAALGGHVAAVEALLQRGALREATNYQGMRPLHLAVLGGDRPEALATARLMLRKPWLVDANAATLSGDTALHLAASHGFVAMTKLLISAGHGRSMAGRIAKMLLKNRAGQTARECAAAQGFRDVEGLLAAAEAKKDPRRDVSRKMGLMRLSDEETARLGPTFME